MRFFLSDLGQHVMVHYLVGSYWDVSFEVGSEDSILVKLVDDKQSLLARFCQERSGPQDVIL